MKIELSNSETAYILHLRLAKSGTAVLGLRGII